MISTITLRIKIGRWNSKTGSFINALYEYWSDIIFSPISWLRSNIWSTIANSNICWTYFTNSRRVLDIKKIFCSFITFSTSKKSRVLRYFPAVVKTSPTSQFLNSIKIGKLIDDYVFPNEDKYSLFEGLEGSIPSVSNTISKRL